MNWILRIAALLGVAAAVAACSSPPPPTTTTPAPADIPTPSVTPPEVGHDEYRVVLDGWSVALLPEPVLTVGDHTEKLEPLSVEKIAALPADVRQKLAARLVATDRDWDCSQPDCVSANDTLATPEMLASPTTTPHYGAVYEAHGIEHGVWSATFPTSAVGRLTSGAWEMRSESFEASETYAVSAGLGRLFMLDPYWTDHTEAEWYYGMRTSAYIIDEAINEASTLVQELENVADPSAAPALTELDASQLTWITSPTTGCGGWVLCSPVASIENSTYALSEMVPVCHEDGVVGAAFAFDQTVETAFPTLTHQTDFWGGKEVADFTPEGYDGVFGIPPLVEGVQTARRQGVLLFDAGRSPESPASLVTIEGDVYHPADAAETETYSAEELVERYLPNTVAPCDFSD